MGNTGKPSMGCAVCRARHYKCDETRPTCMNCSKRGLTCPGYKSQFDVAWRDQNTMAEKSVQRRKKANEKTERNTLIKKRLSKLSSPPVSRAMSQDSESYTISFFLSSYVLLPEGMEAQRSYLDCLYPIWTNMHPQSPLKPAVAAVASFLLEAWSELRPNLCLSNSRSQYLKGLAALRESLQHPEDMGDDTLVTSLLLDMYEGLQAFLKMKRSDNPHLGGTIALIQNLRRKPLAAEESQRVLLGVRNQIAAKAMINAEPVPSDIGGWSKAAQDVPATPRSRLDDLNVDAADFLACASRVNSAPTNVITSILRRAIELDRRFLNWLNTLPDDWHFTRVSGLEEIPRTVRDEGLYQDYCEIYTSVFVANAVNSYRCIRIKFQHIILTCARQLRGDGLASISLVALEVIQDMADAICASVPFHLGSRKTIGRIDDAAEYPHVAGHPSSVDHCKTAAAYGGWVLAPRLGDLLALKEPLRDGQRQWIGRQMQRLIRIYVIQPHKAS